MRRSLLAGIGVLAVLVFAACTDRPNDRGPFDPTGPSLAKGGGGGSLQCAGGFASDIARFEDEHFTSTDADALSALFNVIQSECSTTTTAPSEAVLAYLQKVADLRGAVVGDSVTLAELWNLVTEYATGTPIGRPPTVFVTGTPPTDELNTNGVRGGGAAVLDPAGALTMTTWDGQAGVKISDATGDDAQTPPGPHLFTLYPAACPGTTLPLATNECYNVESYPPVPNWSPLITIGMCIHGGNTDNIAISHFESGYGAEVLPDGGGFTWSTIPCYANDHAFIDTWLGRKAGPLGRALAMGLDYLRPRTLYADDAGESGQSDATTPFGGVKTRIFEELFDDNDPGAFLNGTDPDIGDNASSWDVFAPAPGFANVVDAATFVPPLGGGLTGNVIALSQAQGACKKNCPVYRLLGTRVNPTPAATIGIYEIEWDALQNKPNIKEAPFLVLSSTGQELARLSYKSESNVNRIRYNGVDTGILWEQNVAQSFKIVVRLDDGNASSNDHTTDLYINGTLVLSNVPFKTLGQTTFSTIGYRLDGVDAGIMLADNFKVTRGVDTP